MSMLYARPSDNVTANATPSLTVGSANASYPLTNIDDLDSSLPFKATSGTASIKWTFSGAQVLQGIALFNHNLHGLTLTVTNNAAMASQNLVVPAIGADGLCVNPWLDLRGVANASASEWTIAISGAAANIAIGEVALMSALRTLSVRWGVVRHEDHPLIEHRTDYRRRLAFKLAVRSRFVEAEAILYSERDDIRRLERECFGGYTPFVLIPDAYENDAMLVQWTAERRTETTNLIQSARTRGIVEIPLSFEEQQAGLVL